ncbi:MAG: MmgE/PrpD family protein, partial [Alphaproteobacteria bacterium]
MTIAFPLSKSSSARKPVVEPGDTIAETLARFANAVTYDAIPANVRQRAKELILDSIGIAFASTRYDFAHRTLNGARSLGGPGDHAVIGMATRLPLRDAAMVNGVLIHGLDYDDTHIQAATHITCSLLPTALGVAAQEGLNGKDLLAAYVAGHEVVGRIGSVTEGQWHIVGFHPTGILGAFGCAITAGKLFGASDEQLAMAQGIALSMGSGSLEFLEDGAWTKRMHPGWAAVSGITAAAMAKQGFVGPKRPYEGRFGLWKGHLGPLAEQVHLERATEAMFERWEVMRSAVKPFPACHFNHATADATLALVAEHGLKAEQIRRVLARV